MAQAPAAFNIQTAAKDFGKYGRAIEIDWADRPSGFAVRRMRIKVNGWTISCVWGLGTYCTGAHGFVDLSPDYVESSDAEVAAWPDDGPMVDLGGDTVAGSISPQAVEKAVEAAERGDKAGIRKALVDS